MRFRLIIRTRWHRSVRRWRAWRIRLRRDRAVIALLALLTLGVFEPLICIIHCEIWIPFALQNYFAAQHHHHHMGLTAAADATSAQHSSGAVFASAAQPDGCPLYQGNSSGVPIPPPPSPVHEVTLPLMLLTLALLLVAAQPAAPLRGPPRVFIPVPLRPPILIAG